MSYHLEELEIRKFDPDVKGIYQASSRLRFFDTVDARGASSVQVTRFGMCVGSQSVPGADIPNMNPNVNKVTVYLQNWNHAIYIDGFQLNQVNFDAKRKELELCAMSAGRRKDQTIIVCADTIPNTYDIPFDYEGNVMEISSRMVQRANSILSWNAVPIQDRYLIAPYLLLEQMLEQPEFTSSDYVKYLSPALDGQIVSFGGFKWIFIANNPEGGMPYTVNADGTYTYSCFACHKRPLRSLWVAQIWKIRSIN